MGNKDVPGGGDGIEGEGLLEGDFDAPSRYEGVQDGYEVFDEIDFSQIDTGGLEDYNRVTRVTVPPLRNTSLAYGLDVRARFRDLFEAYDLLEGSNTGGESGGMTKTKGSFQPSGGFAGVVLEENRAIGPAEIDKILAPRHLFQPSGGFQGMALGKSPFEGVLPMIAENDPLAVVLDGLTIEAFFSLLLIRMKVLYAELRASEAEKEALIEGNDQLRHQIEVERGELASARAMIDDVEGQIQRAREGLEEN
jgi:hypothetical protein